MITSVDGVVVEVAFIVELLLTFVEFPGITISTNAKFIYKKKTELIKY